MAKYTFFHTSPVVSPPPFCCIGWGKLLSGLPSFKSPIFLGDGSWFYGVSHFSCPSCTLVCVWAPGCLHCLLILRTKILLIFSLSITIYRINADNFWFTFRALRLLLWRKVDFILSILVPNTSTKTLTLMSNLTQTQMYFSVTFSFRFLLKFYL